MEALITLLVALAFWALIICLPALILVWAWGLVLVPLFHLPQITFLQAWAILFIINLFRSRVTVNSSKS